MGQRGSILSSPVHTSPLVAVRHASRINTNPSQILANPYLYRMSQTALLFGTILWTQKAVVKDCEEKINHVRKTHDFPLHEPSTLLSSPSLRKPQQHAKFKQKLSARQEFCFRNSELFTNFSLVTQKTENIIRGILRSRRVVLLLL